MFASSYLTSIAFSWRYTVIRSRRTVATWDDFCMMVLNEFLPGDVVRRACAWLRRLRHTTSVSKNFAKFRNCVLMINHISAGERFDGFVQGIKKETRLEVLETHASDFQEAARIALHINRALWSQNDLRTFFGSTGTIDDPWKSEISSALTSPVRPRGVKERMTSKRICVLFFTRKSVGRRNANLRKRKIWQRSEDGMTPLTP